MAMNWLFLEKQPGQTRYYYMAQSPVDPTYQGFG